jgi:hypothetical protein
MKSLTFHKVFLVGIFGFCFALLPLLGPAGYAEHVSISGLIGPAFTDLSEIMEMPAEWREQPIKYDPSVGKADLVITLDQHLYPAFLPLIRKYEKEHNLRIFINEGTCGISAGLLSRKAADIGGFCCPPGLTDRLPGLQFHTVGISALALLVHPDNPVDNITIEQAQQIFMGDIDRWSKLMTADGGRGANQPIQPIGRLHCKLRPGHWRLLLDNQDLFSASLREVGAIPDMITKVASSQKAIGYEVLWNLKRYKERGRVKALKIDDHSPFDKGELASGRYPLYRVYNLTTWNGDRVANPEAQKLVEYILQHSKRLDKDHSIIPASLLRQAGWKFEGNELVGGPK